VEESRPLAVLFSGPVQPIDFDLGVALSGGGSRGQSMTCTAGTFVASSDRRLAGGSGRTTTIRASTIDEVTSVSVPSDLTLTRTGVVVLATVNGAPVTLGFDR